MRSRKRDLALREIRDFCVLRFVHNELERGDNKALRWVSGGRAFEVCGKFRMPRGNGVYKRMDAEKLETVLMRYGFRKQEDTESDVYYHRHFRKGSRDIFGKMEYSMCRHYGYRGGIVCSDRWECGELDVRRWYRDICKVYESVREMVRIQEEAISELWRSMESMVGSGVKDIRFPFVYRKSIIREEMGTSQDMGVKCRILGGDGGGDSDIVTVVDRYDAGSRREFI